MEQHYKIGEIAVIVFADFYTEFVGMECEIVSNLGIQDRHCTSGLVTKTEGVRYRVLIPNKPSHAPDGCWNVKPWYIRKKRPPTIPFEEMMNNLKNKEAV